MGTEGWKQMENHHLLPASESSLRIKQNIRNETGPSSRYARIGLVRTMNLWVIGEPIPRSWMTGFGQKNVWVVIVGSCAG